jgi:hypothetical protein
LRQRVRFEAGKVGSIAPGDVHNFADLIADLASHKSQ